MNYKVGYIIMAIGLIIWILSTIEQIKSDIARLNVTLNKIAKQVGVPDTVTDELKGLISEGKMVEAIKKYRMVTGVGLVEAKEYIDYLNKQELN